MWGIFVVTPPRTVVAFECGRVPAAARLHEMRGRFAPSPTGPLHVGNLRTALVAWLGARHVGGEFLVRMEDLDRVTSSIDHEMAQLADLAALGLGHDGTVVRQSERFHLYRDALADLERAGLLYPCFCTRREIREAASAPNQPLLPDGAYPGTCRRLSGEQQRRYERDGRQPAWRLRTDGEEYRIDDLVHGPYVGAVDDVVLQRNDGVPAYNLAVVVDDALQGITQVVRGDDLLSSTPRQVHLQRLLGLPRPEYAHVPLVVGRDGQRLAKRHGAVSLADLAERGVTAARVRTLLAASLGLCPWPGDTDAGGDDPDPVDLLATFAFDRLPHLPWVWPPVESDLHLP